MNRRTFLKVLLGTVAVVLVNPGKVLTENTPQLPIEPVRTVPAISPKIIDIVRLQYPNMIAQQICSVQPMTQQTDEIFTIRYVRTPWYKRIFQRKQKSCF